MAKAKTEAENLDPKIYDVAIVGAGPAGLFQAEITTQLGQETLLLESTEVQGGSARSGFTLTDADDSASFPILTGSLLNPLIIRWERDWVEPASVDWQSKEWESSLPQWHLLEGRVYSWFMDMAPLSSPLLQLQLRSPVVGLDRVGDLWLLKSPERQYQARRVYWAAGIMAFQNAMGKIPAQQVMVENPKYLSAASDYRGGMSLDWELSHEEALRFSLPPFQLFGLPLRFEGKLHLVFASLIDGEEGKALRSFVHLHQDRLKDPKGLSAFQKALRRGLKSLFEGSDDDSLKLSPHERCSVHDRILGHLQGTPWVLADQEEMPALFFIGEESLRAAQSSYCDLSASLESVSRV